MYKVKLFCLPYAGGSASIYIKWKRYLSDRIELHPVELAGRGKRMKSMTYSSLEEVVEDVYKSIRYELNDGVPYAIFGHSMGGMITYELACKLRELNCRNPMHVFFSGIYPPHIKRKEKLLHLLSDEEFKDEILKLGGTDKELFEYKELVEIFMHLLRADYKIVETGNYFEKDYKLDFDISALGGREDADIKVNDLYEWQRYTNKKCSVHEFDGGHFFVNSDITGVTDVINRALG